MQSQTAKQIISLLYIQVRSHFEFRCFVVVLENLLFHHYDTTVSRAHDIHKVGVLSHSISYVPIPHHHAYIQHFYPKFLPMDNHPYRRIFHKTDDSDDSDRIPGRDNLHLGESIHSYIHHTEEHSFFRTLGFCTVYMCM